jgi:glycosyltransferase involved in cell wall biosynthesis
MKKIKVAHILHSVGGVEVALRLILEYIDDQKFENIVIQGTSDSNTPFHDKSNNGVKTFMLPIIREISPLNDFKAIYKAYRIIKKEKPDVIHAHSAKGGVIGRIVGALTNTPTTYSPHAFSYLSTANPTKRKVYLGIEKFFAKGSSTVLALSESERQRAIKDVGFPENRVWLYNNSIEPIHEIKPLSIQKTWPDDYISNVGRPSYQKNTELLIRAVYKIKQQRDIHLVIMGVGYHAGELDMVTKLIKELGLQNDVTLLAWTSREDVFNVVKNAQVYVSTSRYEGMPYSVIEAMSLGRACVVSDCDGNRDLIRDNFNGFVIKDENSELYANKIIRLLDDKELNDMFCNNAKEFFQGHFDVNKNITLLETIYRNIAAKKISPAILKQSNDSKL